LKPRNGDERELAAQKNSSTNEQSTRNNREDTQ
jgi:hypothetical protein